MKETILSGIATVTAILTLAAVFTFTTFVSAAHIPGYERPLLSADMDIVSSRGNFDLAGDVELTLNKIDSLPGETVDRFTMTLNFTMEDSQTQAIDDVVKNLVVLNTYQDSCGSTVYNAQISDIFNQGARSRSQFVGERFSVLLVDHATRKCKDLRPYRWEANVRSGYGWCGTMDAVMKLEGQPHPLYTVASH